MKATPGHINWLVKSIAADFEQEAQEAACTAYDKSAMQDVQEPELKVLFEVVYFQWHF